MPSGRAIILYATLLTGIAACGDGQIEDLCSKFMRCEGGNSKDREACYEQMHGHKKAAEAYNCNQRYSRWADCLETRGECNGGQFTDDGQCDDELAELDACEEAASDRDPVW